MNLKRLFLKALAIVGVATAAPAAAEPILLDAGSVGESFTITFDGFVDGGPSIDGLGSELTLTLTGIENGVYTTICVSFAVLIWRLFLSKGRVLGPAELQRAPLTIQSLASMSGVDEAPLNLNQLSCHV